MAEKFLLAKLFVQPMPSTIFEERTIKLVQIGNNFRLDVTIPKGHGRWKVSLLPEEVQSQLAILKKATLPSFPISPLVCDGMYIEITIYGIQSDYTFNWWTIAPEGAEALDNFVEWLREKAEPEEMGND